MITPKGYPLLCLLIFFFLALSSNTPSHNIRKMARKSIIVEPEYYLRGEKSTAIYCDLIIPVILHRTVGGSKFFLPEKTSQ